MLSLGRIMQKTMTFQMNYAIITISELSDMTQMTNLNINSTSMQVNQSTLAQTVHST